MYTVHTAVFAAGPGGGNPCPVVLGGERLADARCARSRPSTGAETVFVLPAAEEAAARLRFVGPRYEMEMCVHGTIAGVTVLAAEAGGWAPGVVAVQTPLGVLDVELEATR